MQLATVMGGINTGHLYMVPSFNNDGRGQVSNQRFNPAHSYSRGYDNFGTGRARIMNAGTKTTEVRVAAQLCNHPGTAASLVLDHSRGAARPGRRALLLRFAPDVARLHHLSRRTPFRSCRPTQGVAVGVSGTPEFPS